MSSLVPREYIEKRIYLIRESKVMLDSDLAALYDVGTGALNRAFKRNRDRFPADFAFQLDEAEYASLVKHVGIAEGRGGRRYLPYVFTEQGVAMLSSVLKSKRAIYVNIEIMRAFVSLREMLSSNRDLARKLATLEKRYDHQFKIVFDAIRELMTPPTSKMKKLGFKVADKG